VIETTSLRPYGIRSLLAGLPVILTISPAPIAARGTRAELSVRKSVVKLSVIIDALVLAPTGRGAIVRIFGVTLAYFIVLFLPEIFGFMANYTELARISPVQESNNSKVANIFLIILFLIVIAEVVYAVIRWRRGRS